MRSYFALGLLVAVCALPGLSFAQAPPEPLTLKEYVQALDDSLTAVRSTKEAPEKTEEIERSIPAKWKVEVDNRTFEVPAEPIRHDLNAWQSKRKAESLDHAVQYLEMLRQQAAAAEPSAGDFTDRRIKLENILARREFRNVHGQTWFDRLKQRVNELLLRWLGRMFSASVIPVISDVVVYGLIILAVLALAYWMYRSLKESARLETIMPVAVPVSAKQWPIWIAEARAAAARGDWRDAIHLAYWGGISFLEVQGVWRPDVARTPREYLRLLPATSDHQPALRALTMRLESVWYGMQTADEEGFRQTVADLERLGCASS